MPIFALQWDESLRGKQCCLDELPDSIAEIRRLEEELGKSGTTITAMGLPPTREYIDLLLENGVDRMMVGTGPESADKVMEGLQLLAEAVAEYQD